MFTLKLHHADDDMYAPRHPDRLPQTTRLWLSDQQWLTILQRIEQSNQQDKERGGVNPEDRRDPYDLRRPLDAQCLLRVGSHGPESGTFLVRSRNISAGGIGFIHNAPMSTGTRCTVAIEAQQDAGGAIASARVAWCREIEQDDVEMSLFDVGVQFDQPLNLEPFGDSVA